MRSEYEKLTLLMLQLKMGGGNRVFVELAKRSGGKIKLVALATKHHSNLDVSGISCCQVGYRSRNILLRALSYLKLFFYIIKEKKSLGCVVYSDPLLVPIVLMLGLRGYIRFLQADDVNLFNDRKEIPVVFRWLYRLANKYAYKHEKYVICNSRYIYECYRDAGGRGLLLGIVHPGIDTSAYNCVNRGKREYDFCVLAREEKIKGLDIFIDALDSLKKDAGMESVTALMFANKEIKTHTDNADFLLSENDRQNSILLNKSRFFIYPSRSEGFGLPPLEAMACGCVVIAADCGGIREYGKDGNNIIFFEPGNYLDLKAKMVMALESDTGVIMANGISTARRMTWDDTYTSFMLCIDAYFQLNFR